MTSELREQLAERVDKLAANLQKTGKKITLEGGMLNTVWTALIETENPYATAEYLHDLEEIRSSLEMLRKKCELVEADLNRLILSAEVTDEAADSD